MFLIKELSLLYERCVRYLLQSQIVNDIPYITVAAEAFPTKAGFILGQRKHARLYRGIVQYVLFL